MLYPKHSVRLKPYDKHLFHLFSFLGIWIFVSTWTLLARVDWVTSVQVEIGSAAAAGKSLSRAHLCATPWTAAHQAPPSMGFSRQEYWSGVPLPSPESWFSLAQLQFYQLDSTCASLGLKWRAVAP